MARKKPYECPGLACVPDACSKLKELTRGHYTTYPTRVEISALLRLACIATAQVTIPGHGGQNSPLNGHGRAAGSVKEPCHICKDMQPRAWTLVETQGTVRPGRCPSWCGRDVARDTGADGMHEAANNYSKRSQWVSSLATGRP